MVDLLPSEMDVIVFLIPRVCITQNSNTNFQRRDDIISSFHGEAGAPVPENYRLPLTPLLL